MKTMPMAMAALLLGTLSLEAYNIRGFKAYNKLCKDCHGKPFKGAAMLGQLEWKDMFDANDRELRSIHASHPEAMEKLDSSYYKKKRKPVMRFLIENANDTGKAPTCNANVCGDM